MIWGCYITNPKCPILMDILFLLITLTHPRNSTTKPNAIGLAFYSLFHITNPLQYLKPVISTIPPAPYFWLSRVTQCICALLSFLFQWKYWGLKPSGSLLRPLLSGVWKNIRTQIPPNGMNASINTFGASSECSRHQGTLSVLFNTFQDFFILINFLKPSLEKWAPLLEHSR